MGTILAGEASIDPEKGFIMARSMKGKESDDLNNTIAGIYAKIESVQADGITELSIEFENGMNVYKCQDAKIPDLLNKLKVKETDQNVKKYLRMQI
jgi:hypothetical protein